MSTATIAAEDRAGFEMYVERMLAAFAEHTGTDGNVWAHHTSALQARNAGRADADVFAGAWHVVRPYVTQEFRQWVDEYYTPRLTFSQWQAVRRDERESVRSRERDYLESAAYCADELMRWREFDRDETIREMRRRGASFAEMTAATGLARSTLALIVAKDTDGVQLVTITAGTKPDYYTESEPF